MNKGKNNFFSYMGGLQKSAGHTHEIALQHLRNVFSTFPSETQIKLNSYTFPYSVVLTNLLSIVKSGLKNNRNFDHVFTTLPKLFAAWNNKSNKTLFQSRLFNHLMSKHLSGYLLATYCKLFIFLFSIQNGYFYITMNLT